MHNNSNDYDNISERFLLNGQILIDEFADSFAETALFGREDPYRLTGVRLFQKEITLSENYIYLATASIFWPVLTEQVPCLYGRETPEPEG